MPKWLFWILTFWQSDREDDDPWWLMGTADLIVFTYFTGMGMIVLGGEMYCWLWK